VVVISACLLAPWPGYAWDNGFAWGIGIGIGAAFIIGSWDWHNHLTYIHDPHHPEYGSPWSHDPRHRHAVPYRNATLNQQFGRNIPAMHLVQIFGDVNRRKPSLIEISKQERSETPHRVSSGHMRLKMLVTVLRFVAIASAVMPACREGQMYLLLFLHHAGHRSRGIPSAINLEVVGNAFTQCLR